MTAFIAALIDREGERSAKKIISTVEETKEQLATIERSTEEDFKPIN